MVEVLTQLQPELAELDPAIAGPLRALLDDQGAASTDELALAFRKFVETVSREQPLILAFDDIHWGEEALLDLIEHVAFVSTGAPILLVCMARPELLERRPEWRGLLRLEPLTPEEAQQLIAVRLSDREPNNKVSQRILAAAEGNPLFVQEMAAMLQESGDDEVAVPPTIQALLAARLDQLEESERTVLEAAAVEGEVFHRGAVQTLTPDEPRLTAQLTALVRKEFIRPDRPALEGEDSFRFRHLLLRDVTYDAIPKARAVWPARALRRLARTACPAAGRIRRLPPRAGISLPSRPSRYGRRVGRARAAGVGKARTGGDRGARPE